MEPHSQFASPDRAVKVADMEAEALHEAPAQASFVEQLRAKHLNSKQPESQNIVAVLSAIIDVINSQKLQPTPVSVFAAVVSSLSTGDAQGSPQARHLSRHHLACIGKGGCFCVNECSMINSAS